MAVRVLLVMAAFAVLYGCDRESSSSTPASDRPPPLPDQCSQDATLQAYLDQMSTLLLDKGLNGAFEGGAKVDREVRTLARART
jgi:hypothetical protein